MARLSSPATSSGYGSCPGSVGSRAALVKYTVDISSLHT